MPRKLLGGACLLMFAFLATVAAACGGSAQGQRVATAVPERPSATPAATSTATPRPTETTLPDRLDCEEARGTDYRSPAEREWFLANCITPTPAPAVVQPAAQLDPPAAPASAITPLPPVAGAVTAIGDSVMLGAASQLAAAGIDVHAEVSLQAAGGIEAVRQRQEAGTLGSTVIVHLGNNGTFTAAEFDQLMGLLAGVPRVVIVNVKVPRSWEGPNNAMLAANAGRYANAVLVDWHAAGVAHPEYFWDDGIHLRPEGARAYAALLAGYF